MTTTSRFQPRRTGQVVHIWQGRHLHAWIDYYGPEHAGCHPRLLISRHGRNGSPAGFGPKPVLAWPRRARVLVWHLPLPNVRWRYYGGGLRYRLRRPFVQACGRFYGWAVGTGR